MINSKLIQKVWRHVASKSSICHHTMKYISVNACSIDRYTANIYELHVWCQRHLFGFASTKCRHTDSKPGHYDDVIMSAIASQITSLTIVCSIVYSAADQRKHQSSASLAFVWGIHRGPVNSPHKWPVTRKMFPFDDVIMNCLDANLLVICGTEGCRYDKVGFLTALGSLC